MKMAELGWWSNILIILKSKEQVDSFENKKIKQEIVDIVMKTSILVSRDETLNLFIIRYECLSRIGQGTFCIIW